MELGEAHWHSGAARALLDAGRFDRVLGSQHCLPLCERTFEIPDMYHQWPAAEVVREYLAEVARLVTGSDVFAVLAHIDYPVRHWPTEAGPFDPNAFQDEFRHALTALAESGRLPSCRTLDVRQSEEDAAASPASRRSQARRVSAAVRLVSRLTTTKTTRLLVMP